MYLINNTGGDNEYGKPSSFMNSTPTPIHQLVAPQVQRIWINTDSGEALLQMAFNDTSLHRDYGAPAEIWTRWTFGQGKIECRLLLINKTATRLPEASYFSFNPTISSDGGDAGEWMHSILGEWSDPEDVAEGATKGLHYVDDAGVRLASTKHTEHTTKTIQIESRDAGLLRWGQPLPFPTPLSDHVDTSCGPSFCLANNIWNTNYPDWMPFDKVGSNMAFRFTITLTPAATAAAVAVKEAETWSTFKQQQQYMRRAIALAKEAILLGGGGPYGALIVDPDNGGKIVAEGLNRASRNPIWHGEMQAIANFSATLPDDVSVYDVANKYELYTTAEPCAMCMGAIDWSGFGRVIYGTDIPFIEAQGQSQIRLRAETVEKAGFHNITVIGGVLSNETNLLYVGCGAKCRHRHGNHHRVQLEHFSGIENK